MERNIYLRKQTLLPNQNMVQLILREVSVSNPSSNRETSVDQINEGQKYYFIFDFVLKANVAGNAVANFYVKKDENGALLPLRIQSIELPDEMIYKMGLKSFSAASSPAGFEISSDFVDENATQLNTIYYQATGPVVMPIALYASIDENAFGKQTIYYSLKYGNNKSIDYFKDFNIGKKFCINDSTGYNNCPAFLFDSSLIWDAKPSVEKPIGNSIQYIQTGDSYAIKTTATNLTEKAFGNGFLTLTIKNAADYLKFSSDSNVAFQSVNVTPFGTTPPLTATITPIKPTSSIIRVYPEIKSINAGTSSFDGLAGNGDAFLNFSVRSKQQLSITINAVGADNNIFELSYYPFFFVKILSADPVTKLSKPSPNSYWKATVEGDAMPFISGRQTDENGTDLLSFDATHYPAGTNIIFDAWDENNSVPAKRTITLGKPFAVPVIQQECLVVKIDGKDITKLSSPSIKAELTKTDEYNIYIDSNCDTDREVSFFGGELGSQTAGPPFSISPTTTTTIHAHELKQIRLYDFKSSIVRGNAMLGYNILNIYTKLGSSSKSLGTIEVILSDANSTFVLSDFLYDFRGEKIKAGNVKNNSFSGRKDIWYPKISIDNAAVDTEYKKAGVPAKVTLNLKIDNASVEAMIYCYAFAQDIIQLNSTSNCSNPKWPQSQVIAAQTYDAQKKANGFLDINEAELLCSNLTDWLTSTYSTISPIKKTDSNSRQKVPFAKLSTEERNSIIAFQENSNNSQYELATNEVKDPFEDFPTPIADPNILKIGNIYETYPAGITTDHPEGEWYSNADKEVFPGCSIDYSIKLITPPELKFDKNKWYSVLDGTRGRLIIPSKKQVLIPAFINCKPYDPKKTNTCAINYFGTEQQTNGSQNLRAVSTSDNNSFNSTIKGSIYTRGNTSSRSRATFQSEILRAFAPENERITPVIVKVEFVPKENQIYTASSQYKSAAKQVWGNSITTIFGQGKTKEFTTSSTDATRVNALIRNMSVMGVGFLPLQLAAKSGYELPDPNDPTVDYWDDGKTVSKIDKSTIPPGVRVFLSDGKINAEYIGDYGGGDNNVQNIIDFNLLRIEPLKTGYAILTASDYVDGTTIKEQKFRVKLMGSQSNCISSDGIEGQTGKDAVPKVMLDWGWDKISQDSCDTTNNNYYYCDAVQFGVSLFKKLNKINETLYSGVKENELPALTGFYSFLMKDNYSQSLLDDFDAYYSGFTAASPFFNSIEGKVGFDSLITSSPKRINFLIRNENGSLSQSGALLQAGLYRVEIDLNFDDALATPVIIDSNGPHATINVIFSLLSKATTNTAFYELPFDGNVRRGNIIDASQNYGSSPSTGTMALNNGLMLNTSPGALKTIRVSTMKDITSLNLGKVLVYNPQKATLDFYPSQPNPILMTITTSGGTAIGGYEVNSNALQSNFSKDWTLRASTFANGCSDFTGATRKIYSDTNAGTNARKITWNNAQAGTVSLQTVFFTPPANNEQVTSIKAIDGTNTKLKSAPPEGGTQNGGMENGVRVDLRYYDYSGKTNYDTLKGVFDMISNESMCISNNSQSAITVWWNDEYLEALKQRIPIGSSEGTDCTQ
ncbi:MAG: hypothetical protein WCI04_03605 [archaeon]